LAVHFVPFSWLYATPIYIVVGSVISVGTAILIGKPSQQPSVPRICLLTGTALLRGGAAALST
jgi:hypothetical protein